jgi:hypothetical protein
MSEQAMKEFAQKVRLAAGSRSGEKKEGRRERRAKAKATATATATAQTGTKNTIDVDAKDIEDGNAEANANANAAADAKDETTFECGFISQSAVARVERWEYVMIHGPTTRKPDLHLSPQTQNPRSRSRSRSQISSRFIWHA